MAGIDAEYTLYSSPFSLYSMMARHTIQLGPTTHGAKPPKNITLTLINHRKNLNLKEDYLKINPKGQVPSMTGNVLEQPLTSSHAISLYLAENHYPAMLPAEHEAVIRDLLERLHAVPGPSFSNKNPTPEMTKHNPSPVEEILKRTDISPEYRAALEAKLNYHDHNYGVAFHAPVVARARLDLEDIFTQVTHHRKNSGASATDGDWTFGSQVGPTVLDSHLLPFVLRCIEAGNAELVPQELQRWAERMATSAGWERVMHGRPTVYRPEMGAVEDMQDMMSL